MTSNVVTTDMMEVNSVIGDTQGPNGPALSSHLSLQSGHIFSFQIGARIGTLPGLGTHAEDWCQNASVYEIL